MGNVNQKTTRMNFLIGVFSRKQVFLSIISENTCGRGKRRIKSCCGPEIEMNKK